MPSPHAPLYPIFLSLEGRACLVAGLGGVGRRKLEGLLACGPASVLVLDILRAEDLSAEAAALLTDPRACFESRTCTPADIQGRALVFAATGSAVENARIAALCREANVLCNCASAPELGAFSVPAVARQDGLAAALSTGGASPALAGPARPYGAPDGPPAASGPCLARRDRAEYRAVPQGGGIAFAALAGRRRPSKLPTVASGGTAPGFTRSHSGVA